MPPSAVAVVLLRRELEGVGGSWRELEGVGGSRRELEGVGGSWRGRAVGSPWQHVASDVEGMNSSSLLASHAIFRCWGLFASEGVGGSWRELEGVGGSRRELEGALRFAELNVFGDEFGMHLELQVAPRRLSKIPRWLYRAAVAGSR